MEAKGKEQSRVCKHKGCRIDKEVKNKSFLASKLLKNKAKERLKAPNFPDEYMNYA